RDRAKVSCGKSLRGETWALEPLPYLLAFGWRWWAGCLGSLGLANILVICPQEKAAVEYVKTVSLNRSRKHARVSGFMLFSKHVAKRTSARIKESALNDLETTNCGPVLWTK